MTRKKKPTPKTVALDLPEEVLPLLLGTRWIRLGLGDSMRCSLSPEELAEDEMSILPEPLKRTLEDFGHVEVYDVPRLRDRIKAGRMKFDVELLEAQMNELLESREFPVDEINRITSNEFETADEAVQWFTKIRNVVFRGEAWP